MNVTPLRIDGPRVLHPRRHEDGRGFFMESWSRERFAAVGLDVDFVQDNHSCSHAVGTVRGLHFQAPPWAQAKLVRVLRGRIWDVVVDVRLGSDSYGEWDAVELSASTGDQLFVPAGFAHGFCTLDPDTHVFYKVSAPYRPESEGGLRWNDPALGLPWPVGADRAIVADRDRTWPTLARLRSPFVDHRHRAAS